jgi:hypothetical protein
MANHNPELGLVKKRDTQIPLRVLYIVRNLRLAIDENIITGIKRNKLLSQF